MACLGPQTEAAAVQEAITNDEIHPRIDWMLGKYVEIEGDAVVLDGLFHWTELEALVAVLKKYQP